MSFVYPPYLLVEDQFYHLWSINDGSSGFYGYSPTYMKISDSVNNKYNYLHYYWNDNDNLFNIKEVYVDGIASRLELLSITRSDY
jgi:hypothetical protein